MKRYVRAYKTFFKRDESRSENGVKSGSDVDRYGYQGEYAECDPETATTSGSESIGGWNSFDLRMYDSNVGRWLSPDPYRQYWTPYEGMGNDPINLMDPDGGGTDDWVQGADGKIYNDPNAHSPETTKAGETYIGTSLPPTRAVSDGTNFDASTAPLSNQLQGANNPANWHTGAVEPDFSTSLAVGGLATGVAKVTTRAVVSGAEVLTEGGGAVVKSSLEISEHAAIRMSQRGITEKMVQTGISKGTKYFDPKNGTFNYILKKGFARIYKYSNRKGCNSYKR